MLKIIRSPISTLKNLLSDVSTETTLSSIDDSLNIDGITDALRVIPYQHHEIHGKSSFSVACWDLSMGNNDTLIIAFKAPAGTKRLHFGFQYITLTGGVLEVLEGGSWTQGSGSGKAFYNRFREASPQSSIVLEDVNQPTFTASNEVIENPTIVTPGTVIATRHAFAQKNQFTGDAIERDERVLETDQNYMVRFTSGAASNAAEIVLNWYEHTNL